MAFYNSNLIMINNDIADPNKNKVYINPNFNRLSSNHPNNKGMHVNPKFTQLLSNVQPNMQNKSKIYVNPHFMKSRNASEDMQPRSTADVQQTSNKNYYIGINPIEQPRIEREILTVPEPISKTRYSLVRQNIIKSTIPEKTVVDKPKTTIQLNKYKSVPLKDIKLNLDSAKNTHNIKSFNVTSNKKYTSVSCPNTSRNQFKINNKIKKITHRKTQIVKTKLKRVRGNLKKNNIPCPMFKKFGKCIRHNCEFLHDKKHVSICRKFLKGLCHNKNCLLSHDLTTNKMPTCYFYLQGTCTKTDCPYLHVKLSENAKICSDFSKGYCEKGNECLKRHVDIQSVKKGKVLSTRSSLTPKRRFNKVKDKKLHQKSEEVTLNAKKLQQKSEEVTLNAKKLQHIDEEVTLNAENSVINEKMANNLDCRYYQKHKSNENITETCEIIKPLRCKLGTLPSFIQL